MAVLGLWLTCLGSSADFCPFKKKKKKKEGFKRTNEYSELIAGTLNLGLKTIRQMPAIFSHL